MNEHDKLLAKLGSLNEPRESRLSALLRIHRVINDYFTRATTELLSTDLDLLEELIMEKPDTRIERAIEASDNDGGSASDAIQDMLAILRGDDMGDDD